MPFVVIMTKTDSQILKNINNLDFLTVYGSKNWSKLKSFSNKVEIKDLKL